MMKSIKKIIVESWYHDIPPQNNGWDDSYHKSFAKNIKSSEDDSDNWVVNKGTLDNLISSNHTDLHALSKIITHNNAHLSQNHLSQIVDKITKTDASDFKTRNKVKRVIYSIHENPLLDGHSVNKLWRYIKSPLFTGNRSQLYDTSLVSPLQRHKDFDFEANYPNNKSFDFFNQNHVRDLQNHPNHTQVIKKMHDIFKESNYDDLKTHAAEHLLLHPKTPKHITDEVYPEYMEREGSQFGNNHKISQLLDNDYAKGNMTEYTIDKLLKDAKGRTLNTLLDKDNGFIPEHKMKEIVNNVMSQDDFEKHPLFFHIDAQHFNSQHIDKIIKNENLYHGDLLENINPNNLSKSNIDGMINLHKQGKINNFHLYGMNRSPHLNKDHIDYMVATGNAHVIANNIHLSEENIDHLIDKHNIPEHNFRNHTNLSSDRAKSIFINNVNGYKNGSLKKYSMMENVQRPILSHKEYSDLTKNQNDPEVNMNVFRMTKDNHKMLDKFVDDYRKNYNQTNGDYDEDGLRGSLAFTLNNYTNKYGEEYAKHMIKLENEHGTGFTYDDVEDIGVILHNAQYKPSKEVIHGLIDKRMYGKSQVIRDLVNNSPNLDETHIDKLMSKNYRDADLLQHPIIRQKYAQ